MVTTFTGASPIPYNYNLPRPPCPSLSFQLFPHTVVRSSLFQCKSGWIILPMAFHCTQMKSHIFVKTSRVLPSSLPASLYLDVCRSYTFPTTPVPGFLTGCQKHPLSTLFLLLGWQNSLSSLWCWLSVTFCHHPYYHFFFILLSILISNCNDFVCFLCLSCLPTELSLSRGSESCISILDSILYLLAQGLVLLFFNGSHRKHSPFFFQFSLSFSCPFLFPLVDISTV